MYRTLSVELIRHSKLKDNIWIDLILVVSGSIFVALSAQLTIYLPFSPVPITAQTLAVLLCGAVLGSKRGALSLALYILEGAVGLPVFAGGMGGITVLLGPTAGYLAGFLVAAYLVGMLSENGFNRNWHSTLIAFLLGQSIIYLLGVMRLASFTDFDQVFRIGVTPFLIGDAVKISFATVLLPSCWRLVKKLKA